MKVNFITTDTIPVITMSAFIKITILLGLLLNVFAGPVVNDVERLPKVNKEQKEPLKDDLADPKRDQEDDDVKIEENPTTPAKEFGDDELGAALKRFFHKLRNHPEILEKLIEDEESELMARFPAYSALAHASPNDPVRETPDSIEYNVAKTVVKKDGQNTGGQYGTRSSSKYSHSTSGTNGNNIPQVPPSPESVEPSEEEIKELIKEQDKYSQANPFINSLPIFDKIPNDLSSEDIPISEINNAEPEAKKRESKTITTTPKVNYDIKEIKHVPIKEELVSEVPPSQLAEKKELQEEAHQVLQHAEEQAEKTKQYQQSLQEQAQKAEKAKETQPTPSTEENQQYEDLDPYYYYYYYYNEDEPETSSDTSDDTEPSIDSSSDESAVSQSHETDDDNDDGNDNDDEIDNDNENDNDDDEIKTDSSEDTREDELKALESLDENSETPHM